jgi:hypothetical protein
MAESRQRKERRKGKKDYSSSSVDSSSPSSSSGGSWEIKDGHFIGGHAFELAGPGLDDDDLDVCRFHFLVH